MTDFHAIAHHLAERSADGGTATVHILPDGSWETVDDGPDIFEMFEIVYNPDDETYLIDSERPAGEDFPFTHQGAEWTMRLMHPSEQLRGSESFLENLVHEGREAGNTIALSASTIQTVLDDPEARAEWIEETVWENALDWVMTWSQDVG